jgi:hypothetical protein
MGKLFHVAHIIAKLISALTLWCAWQGAERGIVAGPRGGRERQVGRCRWWHEGEMMMVVGVCWW